jgi:hypothetical protein
MTFLDIIRHPITNLPIEQIEFTSFRETLRNKLHDFGKLVEESDNLDEGMQNSHFNADLFKKRTRILINGVLKCVDEYYQGDLNSSYQALSLFMRESNLKGYLNKEYELPLNTQFYRLRVSKGNYPLSKEELFHIPFQSRGKVKTQRYSIPGLPSLYLSNSIYVAWEEMRRPDFNEIQAMRLSNTRPLILLDLTTEIFSRNSHLTDNHSYHWQLLYKTMVFPLLAACSIKVRNTNDTFKPEYIIPQMLLQWVNKNLVDGIMYSSTHIDLCKKKHVGLFYNFVLPVKTFTSEQGYCSHLSSLFKATQVLPMQLRQFSSFSDRFEDQESISTEVNLNIAQLELIEGTRQQYSSTYFGILEHALQHLELEDIC